MRANYHPRKSRASDLIVLVESEIKHKILHQKTLKNASGKPLKKRIRQDCFATFFYTPCIINY